jgi:hypothetical protein
MHAYGPTRLFPLLLTTSPHLHALTRLAAQDWAAANPFKPPRSFKEFAKQQAARDRSRRPGCHNCRSQLDDKRVSVCTQDSDSVYCRTSLSSLALCFIFAVGHAFRSLNALQAHCPACGAIFCNMCVIKMGHFTRSIPRSALGVTGPNSSNPLPVCQQCLEHTHAASAKLA